MTQTMFLLEDLPSPIALDAYDFDYLAEITDYICWNPTPDKWLGDYGFWNAAMDSQL